MLPDHPLLPVERVAPQAIAVIGAGYTGLTAAACFAKLGHNVTCTDVSLHRLEQITRGDAFIVEAGLSELVCEMHRTGKLQFGISNSIAVSDVGIVFLCLPTPPQEGAPADLSYVCSAAEEIGPFLQPETVVVNKSTVPVGTAQLLQDALMRPDVYVVSNPEFLAEGTAIRDFLDPDRIVIGSANRAAAERVAALYVGVEDRVLYTDWASAELIKYASNAYLATRLTFVNSLADICDAVGADIRDVTIGMGSDNRIGPAFLNPGPGWGGSCFPKDSCALTHTAATAKAPFELLETAIAVNEAHAYRIAEKVVRLAGGDLRGQIVAMWGLTFKANTDDLRCSPALKLASILQSFGAEIRAFDPTVTAPRSDLTVCQSPLAACRGAAVLLVATEWEEFRNQDLLSVAQVMTEPVILDARNLLDPALAVAAGFRYEGLGIPMTTPECSPEVLPKKIGAR